MKDGKKEDKQFPLTNKKNCAIYLNRIISSCERCMDRLKKYNIEGNKLLVEYMGKDVVPHEIYAELMDKTSNVTNYLLNLLGDAQTSSISYFKFRNYIPKHQVADVVLNPLEDETRELLNDFNRMRNWQNHIPESLLVAEMEQVEAGKMKFPMDPVDITVYKNVSYDYFKDMVEINISFYEVLNKEIIHEVCYESKRIAVASLLTQYVASAEEAMKTGKMRSDEADRIGKVLLYNLYIKAKAWEHEKEFRIPYPVNDKIGKNVNIRDTGLKTNRIIAGINCIPEDIQRLNDISNQIGCGNVYRSKLSDTKYALEVDNSDYVYRQKRKYFMCCRKHR